MVSEDDAFKAKLCCGCSCCCGCLITIIVLLAMSFKSVSQGEIALEFSHWCQCIIGEAISEPGLKYVSPLNDFIKYPSVYQMLYFEEFANYEAKPHENVKPPILSRTLDGLKVDVKVSFQWRLDPAYVKGVYEAVGSAEDLFDDRDRPEEKPSFVELMVRIARGALTKTCAEYTAASFFANQSVVQDRMYESLVDALTRPDQNFTIIVQALQLRSVNLPVEYESSIADTQKEEQDLMTASAERATQEMAMSTEVLQASLEADELLTKAGANASKILAENSAIVQQYRIFQTTQARAYASVLAEMTDPDHNARYNTLFELMRQRALKQHEHDKLTLSM